MKIWFQNRRVKHKKEDGSTGSGPGSKCCCLRTCGKKKGCEDKDKKCDESEEDREEEKPQPTQKPPKAIWRQTYEDYSEAAHDLSRSGSKRSFDEVSADEKEDEARDEKKAKIESQTTTTIAVGGFRQLPCTKYTVDHIVNS